MRERSSILWMIPPRGWKANRDHNQRVTLLWYLPDIVIYESKRKGAYDLIVPSNVGYRTFEQFPVDRERNQKHWGKVFHGHIPPVSVMEYNAITVSEFRRR